MREIDPYFPDYGQYIDQRRISGKSTSRKDYFMTSGPDAARGGRLRRRDAMKANPENRNRRSRSTGGISMIGADFNDHVDEILRFRVADACLMSRDKSTSNAIAIRSRVSRVGVRIPRSSKLTIDCESPDFFARRFIEIRRRVRSARSNRTTSNEMKRETSPFGTIRTYQN